MGKKGGSGGNVTGYRYYLAMLSGLCRGPIDALTHIKADEVEIWSGNVTANGTFEISADAAFGGDEKEGGVSGIVDMQMGAPTQDLTGSNFRAQVGSLSSLRGAATLFFHGAGGVGGGFNVGGTSGHLGGHVTSNNPYPKAWSFRVWRALAGWHGGTAWYPDEAIIVLDDGQGNVINAMNPAHIIYECLTNPVWGRGLSPSRIDEVSFISAANTLCREKFGLCIAWTKEKELSDFVQDVVNHIGGALYADRTTGLYTIRLLRKDYVVDDLPVFDYLSGLLSIQDDETTAPDNSHSEIIVNYVDPVTNNQRQVRVQNLAGTQANQTVTSTTGNYPGLPTAGLAARIGQRDLSLQANGIKRYTLTFDRRGRKIHPASVFRINIPDRSISNMVLRAGTVEEGPITQQMITVVAVQDVFGLEETTYLAEPEHAWEPPDRTLNPVDIRKVTEINYRDEVRILSAADLATVAVDAGDPVVVAQAPSGLSIHYELHTAATGEPYADHGAFGWTPAATLSVGIGYYDGTMTLINPVGFNSVGAAPFTAWIDDEIVEVTSYDPDTGIFDIERGCVDTLPVPHAASATVWFPDFAQAADGREYTTGEDVRIKLLTRTNTGVLDISLAPEDTWTIVGRQGKPYPPGDFKIGGTPFALVTTQTGNVVFTWAHRDRITQADHILSHTDASTGPEADTTYQTDIYNGAMLLRSTTGITADTWTYDLTMAGADGSPSHITVKLRSERDGILSFQEYSWPFYRIAVGYGRGYGLRYG